MHRHEHDTYSASSRVVAHDTLLYTLIDVRKCVHIYLYVYIITIMKSREYISSRNELGDDSDGTHVYVHNTLRGRIQKYKNTCMLRCIYIYSYVYVKKEQRK